MVTGLLVAAGLLMNLAGATLLGLLDGAVNLSFEALLDIVATLSFEGALAMRVRVFGVAGATIRLGPTAYAVIGAEDEAIRRVPPA